MSGLRYRARAPLRIDFAGGWTDEPSYAATEGGSALTATITRFASGYIARPPADGPLHALRGDRSYVTYSLDAPPRAGLGASAAQTLVWLTLVRSSIENVSDRRDLAERACQVAKVLGILGGKQDEYASALGGIRYFTFGDAVTDERLRLETAAMHELRRRLVLVYSGQPGLPSSIRQSVWSRYRAGDRTVAALLATLKRIAGEMKEALLTGDLEAFGELIAEHWRGQSALHPGVSNASLEGIIDLARANGAVAAKACGTGGGGCLLLMAGPERRDSLERALRASRLRTIDFDFDTYGVYLFKD